jgi:hypothetical protein
VPKNTKILVKFPVSREFNRRQVRSALRRQPATSAFGLASRKTSEWAGNAGFSRLRFRLQDPWFADMEAEIGKVSGHVREYSRFAETIAGVPERLINLPRSHCVSVPHIVFFDWTTLIIANCIFCLVQFIDSKRKV